MSDTTTNAVERECRNIHDGITRNMIPAVYGTRWQDMLRALKAENERLARIVLAAERVEKAGEALGWWMSAALKDPNVSDEMKTAIYDWFSTQATYRKAVEGRE